MKIVMLTFGTHGDVRRYVALGVGLKKAGHEVTICASSRFGQLVTQHGLEYGYVNDEIVNFVTSDAGRDTFEAGGGFLGWVSKAVDLSRRFRPALRAMLNEAWASAQGAEAVIYEGLGGYHISEKLGVPGFLTTPFPFYTPTEAFPCPPLPALRCGPRYNQLTYSIVTLLNALDLGQLNAWRKEVLGLAPRSPLASELVRADGQPVAVLHCYSGHVVPTPRDWPDTAIMTGYWFLHRAKRWKPPAQLTEFIAAGPPPVYVGFGSMVARNPERQTTMVLDALAKSGQRGLISIGWGALAVSAAPNQAFLTQAVPHAWLFPQVAAVVHHGGAGTTAQGLLAGRPTIVCPFLGDQPFWGRRIAALGVGPEAIPRKKMTVDKLADAISMAVMDESILRRAAALGEKIRAEDGVATAIAFIHRQVAG